MKAKTKKAAEESGVLDCVSRLDAAIAVLQLVHQKLWDLMSEEDLHQVNDSHFALELGLAEIKRVTGELREFPNGFTKTEDAS